MRAEGNGGEPSVVYFVSGDIYQISTGGTLCDRMVVDELRRNYRVRIVIPQSRFFASFQRPLLVGLLNNARNLTLRFPKGSLVFVDHGIYRDLFLVAQLWRFLYRCRVVALVYHLDYTVAEVKGGRRLRRLVEKMMVRVYDFVLTISKSTTEQLLALNYPPEQISRIPVSRRFQPGTLDRPRRNQAGPTRMLFVGTVQPRKGVHDAIAAAGSLFGGISNRPPDSRRF